MTADIKTENKPLIDAKQQLSVWQKEFRRAFVQFPDDGATEKQGIALIQAEDNGTFLVCKKGFLQLSFGPDVFGVSKEVPTSLIQRLSDEDFGKLVEVFDAKDTPNSESPIILNIENKDVFVVERGLGHDCLKTVDGAVRFATKRNSVEKRMLYPEELATLIDLLREEEIRVVRHNYGANFSDSSYIAQRLFEFGGWDLWNVSKKITVAGYAMTHPNSFTPTTDGSVLRRGEAEGDEVVPYLVINPTNGDPTTIITPDGFVHVEHLSIETINALDLSKVVREARKSGQLISWENRLTVTIDDHEVAVGVTGGLGRELEIFFK